LVEHKDISTETTLLNYNYKENGTITVRFSNLTRGTITIPQKAICEVQPVTIETQLTPNSDEDIKLLEEVDITKSDLNKEQLDIGKDLILQYKDIFSKGDHDLGHTDRVRHCIDMVDETSFKHRYRRIPPSMYDEVRSHLKQLLDNAVIRPSHSPFASAIVKFKDYLYQEDFTVCTDNNPVTYVLTSAKLDATGHCWLASLAAFHFDIRYRQGRNNADADAPSRLPGTITSESVQPICNVITQEPYVDSLTIDS
jgi:hypothetical protein